MVDEKKIFCGDDMQTIFFDMTICVRCEENGVMSVCECPQKDVARHLGGSIGFVGAIPELNIFILAGTQTDRPVNTTIYTHGKRFHEVAHGPLFFIASDENGDEIDVDVESLQMSWRKQGGDIDDEGSSRWYPEPTLPDAHF